MYLNLLLTVLIVKCIHASSTPVIITENTITTNPKYIHGSVQEGITVNAGAYWSYFVAKTFESNYLFVEKSAEFYLTNTNDVGTVTFGSLENSNLVSILYPDGLSTGPLTISGTKFENEGNLFFTNASQVNIVTGVWENTGIISIEGKWKFPSGLSIVSDTPIENMGSICMTNQHFRMDQQIYGGGCIHVMGNSLLAAVQIDPTNPLDNTIVLYGSSASFGIIPGGATYTVAGFGAGSIISLCSTPITYEYNDQSGILTINTYQNKDYFNIGLGYDNAYFKILDQESITYTGPVPNAIPSKCGVCPSIPIAPSPGNF